MCVPFFCVMLKPSSINTLLFQASVIHNPSPPTPGRTPDIVKTEFPLTWILAEATPVVLAATPSAGLQARVRALWILVRGQPQGLGAGLEAGMGGVVVVVVNSLVSQVAVCIEGLSSFPFGTKACGGSLPLNGAACMLVSLCPACTFGLGKLKTPRMILIGHASSGSLGTQVSSL